MLSSVLATGDAMSNMTWKASVLRAFIAYYLSRVVGVSSDCIMCALSNGHRS